MTVKKLINILKKAKDIDIADISFCVGEKTYEIADIRQFGIIPDVTIYFKEVELPMIRPIKNFRRDKRKMVESKMKEIKKDIKKRNL